MGILEKVVYKRSHNDLEFSTSNRFLLRKPGRKKGRLFTAIFAASAALVVCQLFWGKQVFALKYWVENTAKRLYH